MLLLGPFGARAADLPLRISTETAPSALTTEGVWSVDPDEPNPHRRRWALERKVDLDGLVAVNRGAGAFGAGAAALEAKTRMHLRGEGAWYSPIQAFPCGAKTPDDRFATLEGSREAARAAAALWEKTLGAQRAKLPVVLGRVSAKSDKAARQLAKLRYFTWLTEADRAWRKTLPEVAAAEWRRYEAEARAAGVCGGAGRGGVALAPWSKQMEEPRGEPTVGVGANPLTRAPSRRWSGVFSIRLAFEAGGQKMNGKFLLDPGREENLVSPAWMQGQGVDPAQWDSALPSALAGDAREFTVGGERRLGREMAPDRLSASDLNLDSDTFWMVHTEYLVPPEHIGLCCDGVVGRRLLRRYVLEYSPDLPVHVKFWPRAGFRPEPDTPWIEVSTDAAGRLVSDGCETRDAFDKPLARGVVWEFDRTGGLRVPGARAGADNLRLVCDGVSFLERASVEGAASAMDSGRASGTARVGMDLLNRGPFFLDLAHGRIWFPRETLARASRFNRSGVMPAFVMDNGDRVLKFTRLDKGTPADALLSAGFRPGMAVYSLNDVTAGDLDLWDVRRYLSGAYGATVRVKWIDSAGGRKELRSAELKVQAP